MGYVRNGLCRPIAAVPNRGRWNKCPSVAFSKIRANINSIQFKDLSTSISKGFLKAYRNSVKSKLIELQSKGDEIKWVPENFSINNIPGLRKSERL